MMPTHSFSEFALRKKEALAKKILAHHEEIESWYSSIAKNSPPPLYCSVDLRDSGHKIVPVDSNLFAAGFNNICPEDLRTAPTVVKDQVARLVKTKSGKTQKIVIIPESHTSNLFYLENLQYLLQIFEQGGFEVKLGWWGPLPPTNQGTYLELESQNGKKIRYYPLTIEQGVLSLKTETEVFTPDWVLLNNDFSSGYPTQLDSLINQPVVPSHKLGWHSRKKTEHFKHYNRLAREFAKIIGEDAWTFEIETQEVSPVDFSQGTGIEETARAVDQILAHTQVQYNRMEIQQAPFVFVKNNSGTYGMGIMVVHSGEELKKLNRREKNKMSVGKNKLAIESVCVQEGIPTATLVDRLPAEPVIYLMGCELLGGFFRTNTERGAEDNLNSSGMVFRKLCMTDLREWENHSEEIPVFEAVYGSVARLSALAAGLELSQIKSS